MARLDRFLDAMHQHGASRLRLGTGRPIEMFLRGAWRPVTREATDETQVTSLVREIAPAEVAEQLVPGSTCRFDYHGPVGAVEVRLAPEDGRLVVLVDRVGAGGDGADGTPAAQEDLSEARETMEALLRTLVETRGSDLHLRSGSPPLVRVDGELVRVEGAEVLSADRVGRLLRSIMPPDDRNTFANERDVDWAHEVEGQGRFRCNAGLDRHGPMGVFRMIPTKILTADELQVSREVQNFANLTKGLVLVTGPTGSGKSTTLAAIIDLVNRTRTDHILTIEDPIEFVHESKGCLVTQRQVGVHTRSFKNALRAALREDPDVILVGELRDLETMAIAIETAETGHLVFGTLHTTTAASTLDRIIDQFPADRQSQVRVMLSESLRGVVTQVLCKKIGGGRVAVREILISIPAISNLIREGKTFQIPSIMQTNKRVGMTTLNDALLEVVEAGLVEPREAWLKSADKAGILSMLKAKGHDTSFVGEA